MGITRGSGISQTHQDTGRIKCPNIQCNSKEFSFDYDDVLDGSDIEIVKMRLSCDECNCTFTQVYTPLA